MITATKTVTTWHVEFALKLEDEWVPQVLAFRSVDVAETNRKIRDGVYQYACVRVTGPHQQEIPT